MTLVSRPFRRCYLGAKKLGLKQVMKKRMIGQGELNMLEAAVILCSKYQNQRLHYNPGLYGAFIETVYDNENFIYNVWHLRKKIRHVNGNKFRQRPCRKVVPCIYGRF